MSAHSDDRDFPDNMTHFKALDDQLRCGICFEYFNIAMIVPQCSHNFCSLCIRKFLSYKTQCPTCRVAVIESDLRNNRILDDLVSNFQLARQHLLQLVLDSSMVSPQTAISKLSGGRLHLTGSRNCISISKHDGKLMDSFLVKTNPLGSEKAPEMEPSKTECRESKMAQKKYGQKTSPQLHGADCDGVTVRSPGSSPSDTLKPEEPSTSSGVNEVAKVDCPVCGVSISEQFINRHLDNCLFREEKKDSLRSSVKRKAMAKLVYNLLSDRDLRKKLKEVGLSTQGTRQQLIKRHQDFVHMYNAQCDSLDPKSAAEIAKEIENNEKIQAQLESKAKNNVMTFTKDQTEEEIDGIHSAYRMKHRSEFQQLIDQVKNRWKKPGKRKLQEDSEDKEKKTDGSSSGDHIKQPRIKQKPLKHNIVKEEEPQHMTQEFSEAENPETLRSSTLEAPPSPHSTARF